MAAQDNAQAVLKMFLIFLAGILLTAAVACTVVATWIGFALDVTADYRATVVETGRVVEATVVRKEVGSHEESFVSRSGTDLTAEVTDYYLHYRLSDAPAVHKMDVPEDAFEETQVGDTVEVAVSGDTHVLLGSHGVGWGTMWLVAAGGVIALVLGTVVAICARRMKVVLRTTTRSPF